MTAPLPLAYGLFLVVLRSSALVAAAPVFSARAVPVRARLALGLVLGFAVWSGAGSPTPGVPATLGALLAAAVGETVLGLSAGLGARLVLEAALGAGQAAALSMGLGYGAVLDPTSGAESTAIGELLAMLALASCVALGFHREAVLWLARSVVAQPPGAPLSWEHLLHGVLTQGLLGTALAVRLAFPMLGAAVFGHAVLGVLSRLTPQLNMGSLGFAASLLAGGAALFAVAPAASLLAAQMAAAALGR